MRRFAARLGRDLAAVRNAISTTWSNGQTEGQINRLKTLKRSMYGRAGVDLLRARMLPYAPTTQCEPDPLNSRSQKRGPLQLDGFQPDRIAQFARRAVGGST